MTRRVFRIGSWAMLAAGVLVAAAAATVAVIGVLALTGRVTYPVNVHLGPISFTNTVTMPVRVDAAVCQQADIRTQARGTECFRMFVHDDEAAMSHNIRHQDADVRPTAASLTGQAQLTTTGGWSPLIAGVVSESVIGLGVISGVLLLLWRLLSTAAAGDMFSTRAVRSVRGIGWLVIGGSLAMPLLDLASSATHLGRYQVEAFGVEPHLLPMDPSGVNLAQVGFGALILLLAEVFRHGMKLEAEQRLTV